MTQSKTQTPKIEVDPTEVTTKALCSVQAQLLAAARRVAKIPKLSKVKTKILEAETTLQLALDEMRERGEQS